MALILGKRLDVLLHNFKVSISGLSRWCMSPSHMSMWRTSVVGLSFQSTAKTSIRYCVYPYKCYLAYANRYPSIAHIVHPRVGTS